MPREAKVGFVITSLGGGGAERVATLLSNQWAGERGLNVVIFTLSDGKPAYPLSNKVTVRSLGFVSDRVNPLRAAWGTLQRAMKLQAALHAARCSTVISFGDTTNCLALLALAGRTTPVVISERTDPRHHRISLIWRILRRVLYPIADCLVVQTPEIKNYFSREMGVGSLVIENPVRIPSQYRAQPEEKLIVAVGRLAVEKRFHVLLNSFSALVRQNRGWRLEIYGEGPERSRLQEQLERLGLTESVRLCGWANDVQAIYSRAAIFVMTSEFEGFPNSLCEAMAEGVAVVCFDCPSGPRYIINDEEDGLLVPSGDQLALSRALERLMRSPADRARIGDAARRNIQRFSSTRIFRKWESVIATPEAKCI